MGYLDKIKNSKYKEFHKDLLEYMFDKFELASEEDEDVCFDLLEWDLNRMDSDLDIGIGNGYSLDMQLSLAKYVFNKELGVEQDYSEEEKQKLEEVLERYAERNPKNT